MIPSRLTPLSTKSSKSGSATGCSAAAETGHDARRTRLLRRPRALEESARVSVRSKAYNAIGEERREAQRVLTETKRQQRQALANATLRLGSEIRLEALVYRAWQAGGMGRTMMSSTPGGFVRTLERAAAKYGHAFVQIDARTAKLSQLCHACGAYAKTAIVGTIASRSTRCVCGREAAQRDLYSAFLARFCDARGCVDTRQAAEAWPGASKLLGMAVSTYKERTSIGVMRRSLSSESESVAVQIRQDTDLAQRRRSGRGNAFREGAEQVGYAEAEIERLGAARLEHGRSILATRSEVVSDR